jgi:tetratricopeptide (TPR) repeat protein
MARAWRWSRREPLQAGLVAALGLALVLGFAGITWNWREAVRQKRLQLVAAKAARGEAAKAAAINRFLIECLIDRAEPSNNPASKPVTLSAVLDRAAVKIGSSFAGQPELEGTIRIAIGRAYHGLGEYAKSESHFRAARSLLAQVGDRDRAGRLEAASELGHLLSHLARWDEAEPILLHTLPEARLALGPTHPISLRTAEYLAGVHRAKGRLREAEGLYRSYLEDARGATTPDPDIIFSALFNLGAVFLQNGELDKAEALYRDLVVQQRRTNGAEHPNTLTTLNNLGATLEKKHKFADAERIFRECLEADRKILGDQHPDTVTARFNLGHVIACQGRLEEAEPLIRASVEGQRHAFGAEHPGTLQLTTSLAALLRARGRIDDAEALLRPCVAAQRRVLGPNHRDTLASAGLLKELLKGRSHQDSPARVQNKGVADH